MGSTPQSPDSDMQDGNSISLLPSPQRQNLDRASEKQRQFSEEEMVDGNEDRFTWSKKREYLLSAMGFCVGIGNVWRFPYLCQRNGGGAFLIPFLLSLMLCGLPLYFLESAIGQFSGRSAVHVWSVCPLMKGTGIAINILALVCYWLYNTIMAWALYYLASSCRSVVPWSRCDGWWNTPSCSDFVTARRVSASGNASEVLIDMLSNGTEGLYNTSMEADVFGNGSTYVDNDIATTSNYSTKIKLVSSAEEFWRHNVLQESSTLGEPGHVVWYLAISLCVTQVICFLALYKGIRSSGKVVYVTAVAPYVLLTVLLVRGVTLPGAADGIIFYLKPDFDRLLDPKVWVEAALQVFYSLGPCWGGLLTMASYNKFSNNCFRDSLLLTFVCEGTSIYGGFAIFSVLGYMAHQSGVPVQEVVSAGPGLAFIVYPEAISLMPLPQLWAVLFFIMIVTLVIDTNLGMAETALTTLSDYIPIVHRRRVLVTALFCALCAILGLPLVTQGGVYVFQLVDWFFGTFTVIIIGITECVVLAWVYGADKFGDDIQMMIGRRPPLFMKLLWCFVTPAFLVMLLVATLLQYQPPTYGDYYYGVGGNVFGWFVATVSFVPIPVVAVYQLYHARGTLLQRLRQTTRPGEKWGPADVNQRRLYQKELLRRQPRSGCYDIVCR